ncbi:hypothetical protein GGQ88_001902 [Novosphingobium hassiacum]|uniref:Serine kinase n=1 Tax=Novosphingobium hassiacum TaxID=173676 RepID=A0A7W5ZW76_9SPHN|nr:hypothetical protein [Novosphingobium hassiacum]MBB3860636.1 hypothetical protein [Novosphingobium hassiacum]
MTYTMVWRPAREQEDLPDEPYDVWRTYEGDVSSSFHRIPDGFYVRFNDCGDFSINLTTREVLYFPVPDVPEDYSENLFSNQILPLLWTYDGMPVLHASAVVIDGGAFAFLGQSGRGKSTLAAAMARAGFPFLTDDGLLLEQKNVGFSVKPYLPSIRLLPDSENAVLGKTLADINPDDDVYKARVPSSDLIPFTGREMPLVAVFVLIEPTASQPTFVQLSQAAAIDALLQHSFLLDSRDKARVLNYFGIMAAVAEACPLIALDYPRDFSQLGSLTTAIAAHARSILDLSSKRCLT